MPDPVSKTVVATGWSAVAFSLIASCAWLWFGTLEGFHEGWWARTLSGNLWMMARYLRPGVVLVVVAVAAIRWPLAGGALHVLTGVALIVWWVGYMRVPGLSLDIFLDLFTISGIVLVVVGAAYMVGRPQPRWLALVLMFGLPLAVFVACAIEPVWRISHRVDDGVRSSRLVSGNGVELVWAPSGPGWPEHGAVSHSEAERIVAHLKEDGLSCADTPQNIWRLPTVEEIVASLTRHGKNAGGTWDPTTRRGTYRITPDKESPLWRVPSKVIYWWTSSPAGNGAYHVVCFNGRSWPGKVPADSVGYRAVKARSTPSDQEEARSSTK